MDQTKYLNAYLTTLSTTLHEYVTANLQLRAQTKVLEESVSSLENYIATMQSQLDGANAAAAKAIAEEAAVSVDTTNWKGLYEETTQKLAHYDTFVNQIKDMKHALQSKDEYINLLQAEKQEIINQKDTKITELKKQIDAQLAVSNSIVFDEPPIKKKVKKALNLVSNETLKVSENDF